MNMILIRNCDEFYLLFLSLLRIVVIAGSRLVISDRQTKIAKQGVFTQKTAWWKLIVRQTDRLSTRVLKLERQGRIFERQKKRQQQITKLDTRNGLETRRRSLLISDYSDLVFAFCRRSHHSTALLFLVACYATLHPAMSVRRSVGWSVGQSVNPSISRSVSWLPFILFQRL